MHVTLHLTTGCNMNCSYCYSRPETRIDMDAETAKKAIDYAVKLNPINTGIIFFGGEPLLKRELIEECIDYCKYLKKRDNCYMHFKVTTNGTLLDEKFIQFAHEEKLEIALSLDGDKIANDTHRKDIGGNGVFDIVDPKIDILLASQPYMSVLMVITPETVQYYADSVEYLYGRGFKYVIASINYAGKWDDKSLAVLKKQYIRLSDIYEKMTLAQKKFYFSPFEMKLSSHIKGTEARCNKCALGMRQVSIAPDGRIYPCVQFVQDSVSNKEYSIGDIYTGINEDKRNELYRQSLEKDIQCGECALRERCNNDCSCLNWQTTGTINKVSPFLCESERIIFPIVDKLGKKLFRKKSPLFIQKHYNAVYPILSLLDDTNEDE